MNEHHGRVWIRATASIIDEINGRRQGDGTEEERRRPGVLLYGPCTAYDGGRRRETNARGARRHSTAGKPGPVFPSARSQSVPVHFHDSKVRRL